MNEEPEAYPPYSTAHGHAWQAGPVNPYGLTEAVCACGSGIQFDGSRFEVSGGRLVPRISE